MDAQTPEELAAHFGPEGPVAAAQAFLDAVEADDLRRAWPLIDSNFRLVLVQAWLWANRYHPLIVGRPREEAAAALARETTEHDLWDAFADTQLREFHENWEWDPAKWGAASRPRPVGPDLEIVVFMETGGEPLLSTEPTLIEGAIVLLMRHVGDRWLVAGFQTETPPTPGWPPSEYEESGRRA